MDERGRGEVNSMAFCLQPLYDWQSAQLSAHALDSDDLSNLMWNLFCATKGLRVVSRTRASEKFATITDCSGAWDEVMVLLRNSVQDDEDLPLRWPWLSKRSLLGLQLASLVMTAVLFNLFETGRSQAAALCACMVQCFFFGMWSQYGFDIGGRRKIAKPPKEKVKTIDAPSVSSASSLLRQENEQLKQELEHAKSVSDGPPLPPSSGPPPLPVVEDDAAWRQYADNPGQ